MVWWLGSSSSSSRHPKVEDDNSSSDYTYEELYVDEIQPGDQVVVLPTAAGVEEEEPTPESIIISTTVVVPKESEKDALLEEFENHTNNSDEDDDSSTQERILAGEIPANITSTTITTTNDTHPRSRLHSDVTIESNNEKDDNDSSHSPSPSNHHNASMEETTTEEKQSLLFLAIENDRVDIVHAILQQDPGLLTPSPNDTTTPPLHLALCYGSTHTATTLLRLGADPSLRLPPKKQHTQHKLLQQHPGVTAWELVFGISPVQSSFYTPPPITTTKTTHVVQLSISKQEAIRHAFCAEALRAIGSDQHDRLSQLLASGMPPSTHIGDKDLYQWAQDMKANQCQQLLLLQDNHAHNNNKQQQQLPSIMTTQEDSNTSTTTTTTLASRGKVLDRPHPQQSASSLTSLTNRLNELDSLARALSICLDNLAEEVSVCHGLLILGGGASALATHVRSLKANKQTKIEELERMIESCENSQDELEYWVHKHGGKEARDIQQTAPPLPEENHSVPEPESPQEEAYLLQQLQAQVAASEDKVRKLRLSISDLSEENARDVAEVQRRGLSGGISLVRKLKEEIRDIDFRLQESKNIEATCQMKIKMIQAKMKEAKLTSETTEDVLDRNNGVDEHSKSSDTEDMEVFNSNANMVDSERIANGNSTAIVVRKEGPRGLFPVSLWQIILRIIGFGDDSSEHQVPTRQSQPTITL